jgi:hypothetical protein
MNKHPQWSDYLQPAPGSLDSVTDELSVQFCAVPMTLEEFKTGKHPLQEEGAKYPGAPRDPNSNVGKLRALVVGASVLFPSKWQCSQLSSAIQSARQGSNDIRFTAAIERSLIDGSIEGVRVTRVS